MKASVLAIACLASGALAACGDTHREGPPAPHGRYLGVGTYPAGSLWSQLRGAAESSDQAKARIADDGQIIVVVDSVTGEVRECGDMSGYCIGMNPWRSGAGAMPAALVRHAADLERDAASDGPPPAKARPAPSR
jgi:hypothetical protein